MELNNIIKFNGAVTEGVIDDFGVNFTRLITSEIKGGSCNMNILDDLINEIQELKSLLKQNKQEKKTNLKSESSYIGINTHREYIGDGFIINNRGDIAHLQTGVLINKAEKLLEESIENKVLVTAYHQDNRGIGKSTALVKKANELDCTLITYSYASAKRLDKIAKELEVSIEVIYTNNTEDIMMIGMYCKNKKFLVDEGVSSGVIRELIKSGNELMGGFVNLYSI